MQTHNIGIEESFNFNNFLKYPACAGRPSSEVKVQDKKHLKNVGPIRHCETPHALILHCHSPDVATVARRLRIDVHDNDNNDNA